MSALVATLAGVLAGTGEAAVTRHRAAFAADVAALTAAGAVAQGQAAACAAAERALAVNGARPAGCRVDGPFVLIRDRVAPPGWLAWAGDAAGVARAGPAPDAEKSGGVAPAS